MTRAQHPVYIVKSKVDLKLSGALALSKIVQPRQSERETGAGGDSEDWVSSSESSDLGSQSPGLCLS